MIDLSHPISTGMTVYPGDPAVWLRDALTVADNGVRVTEVHMGSHTGTHLDAPSHTIEGGRTLDEIGLDELYGEALVIRVRDPQPRQCLGVAELGLDALRVVPKIVAIHTAWDRYFGEPTYLQHPFLSGEAAERLCELGMHVLAVDTLNPDLTPDAEEVEQSGFAVHQVVLGSDRLIVENLRGLEQLPDRVKLGFFPLKLGAVDGSPVRAVAMT